MSAFYSICFEDAIRILSDAAIYDDRGIYVESTRKVWTCNKPAMAVTGRGGADAVRIFAEGIISVSKIFGSFDLTVANLPRYLARLRDAIAAEHGPVTGNQGLEMLIAGWGEDGPDTYFFSSFPGSCKALDIEPFQMIRTPADFGAGVELTMEELAAIGINEEAIKSAGTDFLSHRGADLFEAMRRKGAPGKKHPDDPDFYHIGGWLDYTTVTPFGCTTTTIREWPEDRPGMVLTRLEMLQAA